MLGKNGINGEEVPEDELQSIEMKVEDKVNDFIEESMKREDDKYKMQMNQPGAIPNSAKYLDKSDPDGNQLWSLTCMKADAIDYMRVMKRSGFACQEFTFDLNQYKKDTQHNQ